MHSVEFSLLIELHEYSLQATTRLHYSTILEELSSERKGCSKFSKISKKCLRNGPFCFNVTALQSKISDLSKYRLQEKCFLWVFWHSWKFAREFYNEVIWLTERFWKNLFIHFWEDVGKTAVMKVVENYLKNVFSSVPFKKLNCPIHPNITVKKTDSTKSVSFVCSENFQICWESFCDSIT